MIAGANSHHLAPSVANPSCLLTGSPKARILSYYGFLSAKPRADSLVCTDVNNRGDLGPQTTEGLFTKNSPNPPHRITAIPRPIPTRHCPLECLRIEPRQHVEAGQGLRLVEAHGVVSQVRVCCTGSRLALAVSRGLEQEGWQGDAQNLRCRSLGRPHDRTEAVRLSVASLLALPGTGLLPFQPLFAHAGRGLTNEGFDESFGEEALSQDFGRIGQPQ